MGNPRVALIMDHPQRDLVGLVLTAFELCQHGVVCYLVPAQFQIREVWSLMPDFVVLNNSRHRTTDFMTDMVEAGIPFGVLENAVGGWPSPEEYLSLMQRGKGKALLRQISFVGIWGPKVAKYVFDSGVLTEDQIRVTGSSRFDFYHPLWKSVFSNGRLPTLESDGTVLINTTFLHNPKKGSRQGRYYRDVLGWSDAEIAERFAADIQATGDMVDLAAALARDFPERRIVIRPHPYQDREPFVRRLSNIASIEINATGPVQPQIVRAAAVIQRSCMTGLEAGMAGVPTFSPQWVPAASLIPPVEAASVPCNSYEELRERLELVFARRYQVPTDVQENVNRITYEWFYRIDGKAYKRESCAILQCLHRDNNVDRRLCARFAFGLGVTNRNKVTRLARLLPYYLKLPPDWSLRKVLRTAAPTVAWSRAGADRYFDSSGVLPLATRIFEIRSYRREEVRALNIELARERGDYAHGYSGYAVALSC